MFSQLSDSLQDTFKKLRGHGKLSEKNISDAMRDVRMSLLEADVEFSVAKEFIAKVKDKALGESVMRSVTPGQQMVKVFQDELTELLGGDAEPLELNPPARILMVGLNGAGKTTTSAKLALHLKKQGRRPLLVACDLARPAAIEQLATLGREIDVPVFCPEPGSKDVVKTAKEALAWVEQQNGTVVIFDTAGRQEVEDDLVAELKSLRDFLEPGEVLFVADSATGQQAVNVAGRFDEAIGVTGIVLTKLDGDARGGAALSMRTVTGKPIKFSGTGEKLEQLEVFVPDRMAGRILGMGAVVGLVEKAAEVFDEGEAQKMAKKLQKGGFDFNDLLSQMKMMNKMGGMQDLMGKIPGMGKKMGDMKVDERRMKQMEAIILSMTTQERGRPEIIKGRRRQRIARGSGTSVTQVNGLLKQVSMMRKMMKSKGKMKALMAQMGGGKGLPGGFGM